MLVCTICSLPFWPTGRWHHDWCEDCHGVNFHGAHDWWLYAPDPSVQALTPRQGPARRRAAERWAQEEE